MMVRILVLLFLFFSLERVEYLKGIIINSNVVISGQFLSYYEGKDIDGYPFDEYGDITANSWIEQKLLLNVDAKLRENIRIKSRLTISKNNGIERVFFDSEKNKLVVRDDNILWDASERGDIQKFKVGIEQIEINGLPFADSLVVGENIPVKFTSYTIDNIIQGGKLEKNFRKRGKLSLVGGRLFTTYDEYKNDYLDSDYNIDKDLRAGRNLNKYIAGGRLEFDLFKGFHIGLNGICMFNDFGVFKEDVERNKTLYIKIINNPGDGIYYTVILEKMNIEIFDKNGSEISSKLGLIDSDPLLDGTSVRPPDDTSLLVDPEESIYTVNIGGRKPRGSSFTYKISLRNYDIKSIKNIVLGFKMKYNFIVQISANNRTWVTVLDSVKDIYGARIGNENINPSVSTPYETYANIFITLDDVVSEEENVNYGINFNWELNESFNFSGEIINNSIIWKNEIMKKEAIENNICFWVEAKQNIRNILFKESYYNVSPFFRTSFYNRYDTVNSTKYESIKNRKKYIKVDDKYNEITENIDDNIYINDKNGNGIDDKIENDGMPDYRYRKGLRGYALEMMSKWLNKNLIIRGVYQNGEINYKDSYLKRGYDFNEYTGGLKEGGMAYLYVQNDYYQYRIKKLEVNLEYKLDLKRGYAKIFQGGCRILDSIPDNTYWKWGVLPDYFPYFNNLVWRSGVVAKINKLYNFYLELFYRYERDHHYKDLSYRALLRRQPYTLYIRPYYDEYKEDKNVDEQKIISSIKYKFSLRKTLNFILKKNIWKNNDFDFQIIPIIIYEYRDKNSPDENDDFNNKKESRVTEILKNIIKINNNSYVNVDISKEEFRDKNNEYYNYQDNIFATGMVYHYNKLSIIIGYKFIMRDYEKDIIQDGVNVHNYERRTYWGLEERDFKYSTFGIKISYNF